jgi:hypothetical protein
VDIRQVVKLFAVLQRFLSIAAHHLARVIAVDMIADEVQSPVKRSHQAIIV